jgi:hypothetical protein
MVSVEIGGRLRKSMTQLVFPILYFMLRWNTASMWTTYDGSHSAIFLVST